MMSAAASYIYSTRTADALCREPMQCSWAASQPPETFVFEAAFAARTGTGTRLLGRPPTAGRMGR